VAREKLKPIIREMIPQDRPVVAKLEQMVYPDPWSEEVMAGFLENESCAALVLELQGKKVVGSLFYERRGKSFWLHCLTVHPRYRLRGYGRALIGCLTSRLTPNKRNKCELHVRETNLTAQLFFQRLKFLATEVIPEYYEDTKEDAYHMQYVVE